MPGPLASISVQAANALREMERINRTTDRATMWAVRQAGRRVRQEAQRRAPVYKANRAISRKEFKVRWDAGDKSASTPVAGLLKYSIKAAKRLGNDGRGGYSARIAPRGQRVHFYSQAMEARYHYMSEAYEKVQPELQKIAAEAWARATKGKGGK
jgi:hypothetical protein